MYLGLWSKVLQPNLQSLLQISLLYSPYLSRPTEYTELESTVLVDAENLE